MAADTRRPLFLPTYAPQQDQLYSLNIKTTFFDVPGRAPRWASHSSSDYSGTWLPQIVRWTLERLTNEGGSKKNFFYSFFFYYTQKKESIRSCAHKLLGAWH